MRRVFGDSLFFIALLNERDLHHRGAVGMEARDVLDIVTTRWVLAEVADALSAPPWRQRAAAFVDRAKSNARLHVIENSDRLFDRGLDLYRSRTDKGWSLTDCISFIVMADEKLTEALTADRHFEQAGYVALLAS